LNLPNIIYTEIKNSGFVLFIYQNIPNTTLLTYTNNFFPVAVETSRLSTNLQGASTLLKLTSLKRINALRGRFYITTVRFFCIAILYIVPLVPIFAQHLPGVAMGNYSGTQALFHNPAFVADSRFSVYGNLVGTQLYIANNFLKYNQPYSIASLFTGTVPEQYHSSRGKVIFDRNNLEEKLNGRIKHLNAGGDTRLPSLMVSLFKGKVGVAVTTRARYLLNQTETTEPLARLLKGGIHAPYLEDTYPTAQSAKVHLNGLGEIGFTLGGEVVNNEVDYLKVGITVKRLIGLYNAHVELDHVDYEVTEDNNPYPDLPMRHRQQVTLQNVTGSYGYTTDAAFENFSPTAAWFLGNAPAGTGWGFDLGVVYEYRPDIHKYTYMEKGVRKLDASKNKYLYRVALSLTDIGNIAFKNANYVVRQSFDSNGGEINTETFRGARGIEGYFSTLDQALGASPSLRSYYFKSKLPMAFQASVDYNIKPKVYVNTLWVQSLRSAGSFGMKAESILSVTPRYEDKWYEVSVPVSLLNKYGSLGIGLAGRFGPFWLGTDHLAGMLNIGKPKLFNFYAGISTGLLRRPPASPNPCYPNTKESLFKRLFPGKRK
jgi:hypothetical protein